ncbi:hypothetical protein PFISCL1PPCAC_17173, partial [Pristionchus fissidentatus]
MGWSHRRLALPTVLWLVQLGTVSAADPFNLPPLDCSRVNVAFCCTSRIRSLCPTECSGVPCGPSFYHTLFSTDGDTSGMVVGAGQPSLTPDWSFQNGRFREQPLPCKPLAFPGEVVANAKDGDSTILTPSKAKPFESATTILPALGTPSPYFSGVTGFPTLIPDGVQSTLAAGASSTLVAHVLWFHFWHHSWFHARSPLQPYPTPPTPAPSQVLYVSSMPTVTADLLETSSDRPDAYSSTAYPAAAAAAATLQPTTAVVPARTTAKPRRRTTPDPRIIKPPSELVIISEYDEDEPPESLPASVIPSMTTATAQPVVRSTTVATASAAPTLESTS